MTDPTAGAAGGDGRQGALGRGADLGKRAFDWFASVVPALVTLSKILKGLAIIGLVAPVIVVLMLLVEWWPPDSVLKIVLVLAIIYVVLAWLPFSLYGFAGSVRTLSEVPSMLQGTPDLYNQYSGEVIKLYQDMADPATGRARGVRRGAFGGLKLVWRMRKEVPDVAGIASLARASLFFLAAGGVVMAFVNVFLVFAVGTGTALHT